MKIRILKCYLGVEGAVIDLAKLEALLLQHDVSLLVVDDAVHDMPTHDVYDALACVRDADTETRDVQTGARPSYAKKDTCPPSWRVWRPDQSETLADARSFRALTAASAAEEFAEWSDDNGEGDIVRAGESGAAEVSVCPEDADEPVVVFVVRGEYVPQYYAEPK